MLTSLFLGGALLWSGGLGTGVCLQQTRTVGPEGTYSTIPAAIDAADDGDTILLTQSASVWKYTGVGNYNLHFNQGESLTLIAEAGSNTVEIHGVEEGGPQAFTSMASWVDSSYRIEGILFRWFEADSGNGLDGGAFHLDGASPTFVNCTFIGNAAVDEGGAVYCKNGASPTFEDCEFNTNFAAGRGGAVCTTDGSAPTFLRCHFLWNTGSGGGAVRVDTGSDPQFVECIFENNAAVTTDKHGGAVTAANSGSVILFDHCFFINNDATGGGGGVSIDAATATLRNCVVGNNECGSHGGGVRATNGAQVTIESCTIVDNAADGSGGGLRAGDGTTDVTVVNTLFWGNEAGGNPNQINKFGGPTVDVDTCCVEGGWTSGTNIVDDDPDLVAVSGVRYHFEGSSCENVGLDSAVTWAEDIDGDDRTNGQVDIGAWER